MLDKCHAIPSPIPGVELWAVWQAEAERELPSLLALLSEMERQQLLSFYSPKRYKEYIIGRAYLRLLLAAYLKVPPPAIAIAHTVYGKPYIPQAHLQFNLSHSQGLVVYGISWQYLLGVDIEYIYRSCNYRTLSKRYFQGSVANLEEFWQLWTQKEAIGKAMGVGIWQTVEPSFQTTCQLHSQMIFHSYYLSIAAVDMVRNCVHQGESET
ncbi:MAG: 4'-phosphopantetheinyl transferase family protein [Pseudanabaenaceae cyanobacterium]